MSISKHAEDHKTTGIALISIRDRFCPCSRDSSGDRSSATGFLLFHLNRYGSPPGVAISLVPLWFPWWFYVVLNSLLGVPMALFF